MVRKRRTAAVSGEGEGSRASLYQSSGGGDSSSQARHLSSTNVKEQLSGLSSDSSGLHQASPQQHQPPFPEPHLSSADVTEHFSSLSLDHEDKRIPLRPGIGRRGTKCSVTANHFSVKLPDIEICQYDVTITPKDTSRKIITTQGVNRAVMNTLVNLYRQTYLLNKVPAYDGQKILYTAGPLPFELKVFEITLVDEYDSIRGAVLRGGEFTVKIKLAVKIDLQPTDALQEALNTVFRERPIRNGYVQFGRSFYSLDFGSAQHLNRGLDCWQGFFQSIRLTQMGSSLNHDVSYTAVIKPDPVIVYVTQLLERSFISSQPLSDADHAKIKKGLIGIKVEVIHRGETRRRYRISGLTSQATRELTFPDDKSGTLKSVVEYFLETYGLSIEHTQLPCLQMGNKLKPIYLPMEVCKIVPGQTYSKRLNKEEITKLLQVTNKPPTERKKNIENTLLKIDYPNDECAQGFGIEINPEMAQFDARILPPPELEYNNSGRCRYWLPRGGVWSMNDKKLFKGEKVNHWICLNFASNIEDTIALEFCQNLANTCINNGMTFSSEPVMPPIRAHPNRVESVLKTSFHKATALLKGKELDLLIVVLPDKKGSIYGDLKRICETDLGIVSQCCLAKNVYERKNHILVNLSLKINVKVGGRNTVLARSMPIVSDRKTIIFGADVTHPSPGDYSSPSIAAVVASQDWPKITKYASLVSAQAHRQEMIQDLFTSYEDPKRGTVTGGMIKDLLISFHAANGGTLPESIIFYRDGVSEGQFNQVLLFEVGAIRRACASLDPNYQPRITFVVVQKRHHTRLFPNDRNYDKSGNVLPGTVVDTTICHPTQFDFYLCSHAGIKGTSRPAHYHVLWDENNFSADDLQTVTYNLCYTYARCTRAVSIVPPVYYAHLAAFRARCYIESETSGDDGGGGAVSAPPSGANVNVTPLPALKEKVKWGMFFC